MNNPGHTLGQVSELTLVNPIIAGQVEILRRVLHTLNEQRIFAPVTAIHFARFVIITPPGGDVEHDSYLMFTCNYDGDFELLVTGLAEQVTAPLDTIWSHTPGWTGCQPTATFELWVLDHVVRANMAYTPYAPATVKAIRKGLAVDAAVQELFDAIRTQPAAQDLLQALAN